MKAAPDPEQQLLELFASEPASGSAWADLPAGIERLPDPFWEVLEAPLPGPYLGGIQDLARGPWLEAIRGWESKLARLRDRGQGLRILLTIIILARAEGRKPETRHNRCVDVLRCYLNSVEPAFLAAAMTGLAVLRPHLVLDRARDLIRGHREKASALSRCDRLDRQLLVQACAFVLARLGGEADWHAMMTLLSWRGTRVGDYTRKILGPYHQRVGMPDPIARELLDSMVAGHDEEDEVGGTRRDRVCLQLLRHYRPDFFPQAMEIYVSQAGSRRVARVRGVPELIPALANLARNSKDPACPSALKSLATVDPARALGVIRENRYLARLHPELQTIALDLVEEHSPTVDFMEDIITCSRGPQGRTKLHALKVLGRLPEPEAAAEVLSMLSDPDTRVAEKAREYLERLENGTPFEAGLARAHGPQVAWWQVRHDALGVLDWGEIIGRKLLGRMVHVQPTRRGMGFTFPTRGERGPALICVSERPVLRGLPHGPEIMQGLLLHEIAHHLHDFSERGFWVVAGPMRKAGLGHLFNLLCDERIERRMRRDVSGSGILFDRLAAHVFCRKPVTMGLTSYAQMFKMPVEVVAEKIQAGLLPGGLSASSGDAAGRAVTLAGMDLARLPGAEVPYLQFAMVLRAGYPRSQDLHSAALAALELIPPDLRSLNHHRLSELTVRVASVLGGRKEMRRRWDHLQEALSRMLAGGSLNRWLILQRQGAGMDGDFLKEAGDRGQTSGRTRWREELNRWNERAGKGRPRKDRSLGRDSRESGDHLWNDTSDLSIPPMRVEVMPEDLDREVDPGQEWRRHARTLEKLIRGIEGGQTTEGWSWQGRRLDPSRLPSLIWQKNYRCMSHDQEMPGPNYHFGLLIDRSGSMQGARLHRARSFGMLLCEALKNRHGIAGHVGAFDHDTYYDLGDLGDNRIPFLHAGGANNDAGALLECAKRFPADPALRKILIMISDGLPTGTSAAAVKEVVESLEKRGFVCVQVAVAELKTDCFRHFVDLSHFPLGVAVARFGRLVMRLIKRAA